MLKKLCRVKSDQDVELEERPKLCVLKELVSVGFEATCVGVRRKKIRKILSKVRSLQQSRRHRWGKGEV